MVLVLLATLIPMVSAGAITIDGDNSDWVSLGLTAVGTDAPNNTGGGHDACADLLEAWMYCDTQNLYLMMKVNGGYSAAWADNTQEILINTDNNPSTGNQIGSDYTIGATNGISVLLIWNSSTDSWDTDGTLSVAAGSEGYIEWEVSLSKLNITGTRTADFTFATYDNTLHEMVDVIMASDLTIPEMPNIAFLLPLMVVFTLFAAFMKPRRQTNPKTG